MPSDVSDKHLDQKIATWRDSLTEMIPEKRDELEDHLRSSLPELLDKELSIDEAILLAAARLESATVSPHNPQNTQTIRHPILRILMDTLVCVIAGFGCLASITFTLYALTSQNINASGFTLAITIGVAICGVMIFLARKAAVDIHRTTIGLSVIE